MISEVDEDGGCGGGGGGKEFLEFFTVLISYEPHLYF
jgi:hypothetical protein